MTMTELQLTRDVLDETQMDLNSLRDDITGFLHDDVGSCLIVCKQVLLSLISDIQSDKDPSVLLPRIESCLETIKQTYSKTRRFLDGGGIECLSVIGLKRAIQEFVDARYGPLKDVRFDIIEKAPACFTKEQESAALYIVQESLLNAVKHAQASCVCVTINRTSVTIEDDGIGLSEKSTNSIGTIKMRSMASACGGCFSRQDRKPCGVIVEFRTDSTV